MFGRICNLLFFAILGYFAIKILPSKKLFMIAILLSPKIFYISSTLSPDVFTNIIPLLFLAMIFRIRKEKTMSKKQTALLAVLSIGVALCKVVYFPICVALVLLPREVFANKKGKKAVLCSIWIAICILIALTWLAISATPVYGDTNSTKQAEHIKAHPIQYVGIGILSVTQNIMSWGTDVVGGGMDWSSYSQLELIEFMSMIALILALTSEKKEEEDTSPLMKGVCIGIALFIVGAIITSLYVTWTSAHRSIGSIIVTGIQGRYFVPILILFANFLPIRYIEAKEKLDPIWFYALIVLCNVATLLHIFSVNIL